MAGLNTGADMMDMDHLPLWVRPNVPDPRTDEALSLCRGWMDQRGITEVRPVYRPAPRTRPRTVRARARGAGAG